jgi:hypothetical protein
MDLRVPNSSKYVSKSMAKKTMKRIKAFALVECSAMHKINLHLVFEKAIMSGNPHKTCGCMVL